jgi:hypothetical protein
MVEPRALRIIALAFLLAAVAYVATMYVRSPLSRVSGVMLFQRILILVAVLLGLYVRVWRIPAPLSRVFSVFALAAIVYLIVDGWRLHLLRRDSVVLYVELAIALVIACQLGWPFFRRVAHLVRRS